MEIFKYRRWKNDVRFGLTRNIYNLTAQYGPF